VRLVGCVASPVPRAGAGVTMSPGARECCAIRVAGVRNVGVQAGLGAAVLFGTGTPLAKVLQRDQLGAVRCRLAPPRYRPGRSDLSVAPFVSAVLALALGEPLSPARVICGAFMGVGVWLHLTEHHAHKHTHPAITHSHEHYTDSHHRHPH